MIGFEVYLVVLVAVAVVLGFMALARRFIRKAEQEQREVEKEQASRLQAKANPPQKQNPHQDSRV